MSKPERGSLSVIKRALPNLPPAPSPKDLESKLLGPEVSAEPSGAAAVATAREGEARQQMDIQMAIQQDVQQDVHPAVQQPAASPPPATRLSPRPGKRKEPVQMVTYRIPASLYDRLFRIAEYNNLNMTDIVVEAIERHLPNFPEPRD